MSQLEGIYLTKGGATRKVNKITKNLPSSTSQATVEVAKLGNIWINLVRSSFVCFLTPDHMTGESQDGVCATETRCRRQCLCTSSRARDRDTRLASSRSTVGQSGGEFRRLGQSESPVVRDTTKPGPANTTSLAANTVCCHRQQR